MAGVAALAALLAISPTATAAGGQPSPEAQDGSANLVRVDFAQATLDIGVAYFFTHDRVEPNLNGISISEVPPKPTSDHRWVSRLVAHASRRDLPTVDAFEGHLAGMLDDNVPCIVGGFAPEALSCPAATSLQLPSLGPAPYGALELEAFARTEGTPITAFDLLTAAFETAQWRPAGIHPRTAAAARLAAAQMRHRTSQSTRPCHVTALWVAAAIVADAPDIRLATAGFWLDGDTVVHLGSLARHAARRGCLAAAATSRNARGAQPASLVFWDPASALAVSARAGSGIARTLGDMTVGNLRPQALQLSLHGGIGDASSVDEPFRACDAVTEVASSDEIVFVRGIEVHTCLAGSLRELLTAARRDGIILRGWGWRSTAVQIGLRREHCPLPARSAADYWLQLSLLPSFSCNPPVARPTTSAHEFGLAVDFTCATAGAAITRTSRCFKWLAANAHRYGLYNLASEPWHWSTTGR
ncbi:D-alanyl-D-alanine carboxypeptidase family protein [Candidatus Poriferisodalis sp.]|uniref:D-alanyl-D-alanine carboxypeptidase family protein n=1 Tax=Candidatus Poriferisodalis sp. TaxID=3101277 RepID=UPI003AF9BA7F